MEKESFRIISGANLHVPISEGTQRLDLQQEDEEISAGGKCMLNTLSELYEDEGNLLSDQARKLLNSKDDAPNKEP